MAEYVKIYCCGDCGYYDWRKHKCQRGAKVDDGSRFFRDCPIGIHEEKDGERVDTVPVRHGRWINEGVYGEGHSQCSIRCSNPLCNFHYIGYLDEYNYCPNCGAKMDGKDKI